MRLSKIASSFLLAAVFYSAAGLAGCGHKETAQLSEGSENSAEKRGAEPPELPIEQQTEQKLDPLKKEDVDLYLRVMRAAADRVKNPTAADKAALDGAKKILAASSTGHLPTGADVKTLERANLVAVFMDQIVAEDMKLDGRVYRGIAEAVESVMPDPRFGIPAGDGTTPSAHHAPTPLESRIRDVNAANEKFLDPYRDEVKGLIGVVRDPTRLPK